MAEIIIQILSGIFGIVFVGGMLGFIYKRHAEEWDVLAKAYGRNWQKPILQKRFRSMVLYRKDHPARPYAGILTMGIYPNGIGLRMSPLLAPFHAPVFIPFNDLKGFKQSWYWDSKSVELTPLRTPDMCLIMPKAQVDWISENSSATIVVSAQKPAHGNYPWLTQGIAIYSAFMLTTVLGIIAFKHFNPSSFPGLWG